MKHIVLKSFLFSWGMVLVCGLCVSLTFPTHVFAVCTDSFGMVLDCAGAPDGSIVSTPGVPQNTGTPTGPQNTGTPVGPQQVGGTSGSASIQNPLQVKTVSEFIEKLLKAVIQIGVPIAVLFIILAGFKFITAQGSPDELAKARRNFFYVLIGIAIFIGAWALAQLIVATLRNAGILA